MAEIGKYNTLRVEKEVDFGVYLFDEEMGEILLPTRYVPKNCKVDDELEVFLYRDSEDRIIATTEKPFAVVEEFVSLEVASTNTVGAFLDWGLPKDLLLPYREQTYNVQAKDRVIVFVYLDLESKRLVASARLDKFLDNIPTEYEPGQAVNILIAKETDLGYKCIIENKHWGILYKSEVFKGIKVGTHYSAYINKIRRDEKIDLILEKPGYDKIDDISQIVLDHLKANNNASPLHDKSDAEDIKRSLGISKKSFKKALGKLYKSKLIALSDSGIKLA